MVDFARIQNRIYYGYTKAAIRLGTDHAIYRSTDGNNPIQIDNFLFTTKISVDADLKYNKARKYGDPTWYFLPQNGLTLQNYDYMVGETITYFIADIAPDDRLSPPLCVECNSVVTITRPTGNLTPGKNTYQQYQPANATNILVNCPVSILQHGKMDSNNLKLPTSVRLPYYSILLPDFDNIILNTGDIINDSNGRRLVIISAEKTKRALGLRIIASELGT